jgi:hypothetical protein
MKSLIIVALSLSIAFTSFILTLLFKDVDTNDMNEIIGTILVVALDLFLIISLTLTCICI